MHTQLTELARYRGLLENLVLRDMRTRYRGTVFGFAWTMLEPFGMMVVYAVVFKQMAGGRFDIRHYTTFLLCGLLSWKFFAQSISVCATSLVSNPGLIKKVYFPWETLPIAEVFSGCVHLVLACVPLAIYALIFGPGAHWTWLLVPPLVFLQLLFVTGAGLLVSVLTVRYRDVANLLSVVTFAAFFLTPILYPVDYFHPADPNSALNAVIGPKTVGEWMWQLNPMALFVEAFRWAVVTPAESARIVGLTTLQLLYLVIVSLVMFLAGLWLFNRRRHMIAEEI